MDILHCFDLIGQTSLPKGPQFDFIDSFWTDSIWFR